MKFSFLLSFPRVPRPRFRLSWENQNIRSFLQMYWVTDGLEPAKKPMLIILLGLHLAPWFHSSCRPGLHLWPLDKLKTTATRTQVEQQKKTVICLWFLSVSVLGLEGGKFWKMLEVKLPRAGGTWIKPDSICYSLSWLHANPHTSLIN